VLARIIETREKPLLLLLLRNVEEQLHDPRAVAVQVMLECIYVLVTSAPQFFAGGGPRRKILPGQDLGMDPHDENLFVVRAVEYPDAPAFGQCIRAPPEKVVLELERGRLLERGDLAALRIDPGHHVLDGAVLAGSIERLEDDEQRVPLSCVEQFLRPRELVPKALEILLCELLLGRRAFPAEPGCRAL
jgi:hypothetical protein